MRVVAGLGAWLAGPLVAGAQSFSDEFSVPGDRLDRTNWTTEFSSPSCDQSFFGRTQLRDWVRPDGVGRFVVEDGAARLALDTYNPTSQPGNPSLFGTHAKTGTYSPAAETRFLPSTTTDIVLAVRMRLTTLQRGIVYGVYFYYPYTTGAACADVHDEIDIEVVTNFLHEPLPRVQLNRYAAEPLGDGHGETPNLPAGFDPLGWHEWKIRWGVSRLTFYVDDVALFSTTTVIPQRLMHADIVAWGPGPEWAAAYHSSLQPVTSEASNQAFTALVDRVVVRPVSAFTDSVLSPGSTVIRVAHVTELRAHVDSLRAREGLSPFDWSDPNPAAGTTLVRAQHVIDLRAALSEVYIALGRSESAYTDSTLSVGTAIKSVHIDELRARVMALE